jgi:hypothetical protein
MTVASPNAPVLIPGTTCPVWITGSFAPLSVAVSLNVWADTGAAANPTSTAATRTIIQREVIRILLLWNWDCEQGHNPRQAGRAE